MNIDIDIEKLNLKEKDLEVFNLFIDFLVENEIYKIFLEEVHRQKADKINTIIKTAFNNKEFSNIISLSLTWVLTKQGISLWYKFNNEWKTYLQRISTSSFTFIK